MSRRKAREEKKKEEVAACGYVGCFQKTHESEAFIPYMIQAMVGSIIFVGGVMYCIFEILLSGASSGTFERRWDSNEAESSNQISGTVPVPFLLCWSCACILWLGFLSHSNGVCMTCWPGPSLYTSYLVQPFGCSLFIVYATGTSLVLSPSAWQWTYEIRTVAPCFPKDFWDMHSLRQNPKKHYLKTSAAELTTCFLLTLPYVFKPCLVHPWWPCAIRNVCYRSIPGLSSADIMRSSLLHPQYSAWTKMRYEVK